MPAPNCGFFWDEDAAWYMRQWDNNSRLVSICDRVMVSDPDVFTANPQIMEEAADILMRALPEQASKISFTKTWHCFRTYTEDQLPIFGADPDISGLFWLGAFGGLGMSTSFAAALDAAALICGEKVELKDNFNPDRVKLHPLAQRIKLPEAAKIPPSSERTRAIS